MYLSKEISKPGRWGWEVCLVRKVAVVTLFLFLCCVFSGCSSQSDLPAPLPAPAESSEPAVPTLQLEEYQLYERDAQQLDVSPLHFTEVLGVRKRYENALPAVIGFQYPYVFYERMAAVVEGATEEDPAMVIGRY